MKILSIAFFSVLILTVSCSKKNDSSSTCQLVGATLSEGGSNTTFSLTYNTNGKLATTTQTGGGSTTTKTFTYGTNLILVSTNYGSGTTNDSITLNGDGTIASDISLGGGNRTVTTYSYNGSGQLTSSSYDDGSNSPDVTTYTFTNGDLTGSTDGSNTSTYTYYTNKPIQTGDYFDFVQLVDYGAYFIKNTHLIESFQEGTTVNINYTFDNTNKITGFTTTGSETDSLNYQYNCN